MRDFIVSALESKFTGQMSLPGPAVSKDGAAVETRETIRTTETPSDIVEAVVGILDEKTTVEVTLHCALGQIKRYDVHRRERIQKTGRVTLTEERKAG